ncbi:MAG: hypothetical protein HND48_11565 [Chloroflexi bacterium]|nr:hypothetical protein [Chloroflexota bacterium]
MTLAWTAADAVTPKLIPVVRVMDSAGRDIARSSDDRPGGLETQHWRPEQYVIQQVALMVPGGTPPDVTPSGSRCMILRRGVRSMCLTSRAHLQASP